MLCFIVFKCLFLSVFFYFLNNSVWWFAMITVWCTPCETSMIMAKCNFENPRANENPYINDDIDLNDLLRAFDDDPNSEVKTFTFSPYIDIEGLTPLLSRYKNGFAVLSLNIQSITSKFDALTAVLSELNNDDIKFDAICLQETWLPIDQDTALFNIPRYQLISQGKSWSSHSGLMIFLSNVYSLLIRSSHNNSQL